MKWQIEGLMAEVDEALGASYRTGGRVQRDLGDFPIYALVKVKGRDNGIVYRILSRSKEHAVIVPEEALKFYRLKYSKTKGLEILKQKGQLETIHTERLEKL